MGQIDTEKEEISWMKFWIGVGVASIMGLLSWFTNHYETANTVLLVIDIITIFCIAVFIVLLNKKAVQKIKSLKDL